MKISNRALYLFGAATLIVIGIGYENTRQNDILFKDSPSEKLTVTSSSVTENQDITNTPNYITITIDKNIEGDFGTYFQLEEYTTKAKKGDYFLIKLIPIKKGRLVDMILSSNIKLIFEGKGYANLVDNGYDIQEKLNQALSSMKPVKLQFEVESPESYQNSNLNAWIECDCSFEDIQEDSDRL